MGVLQVKILPKKKSSIWTIILGCTEETIRKLKICFLKYFFVYLEICIETTLVAFLFFIIFRCFHAYVRQKRTSNFFPNYNNWSATILLPLSNSCYLMITNSRREYLEFVLGFRVCYIFCSFTKLSWCDAMKTRVMGHELLQN